MSMAIGALRLSAVIFNMCATTRPLSTREWVLTEVGRESRIGFELDCKRCDDEVEPEAS